MKTRPEWYYKQSAVIPYRKKEGKIEVLLITSRNKGNWIIPKGIIEIGMTPEESAAKEAMEEAGVVGLTGSALVGKYDYEKWGGTCRVKVFPLLVKMLLDKWPEKEMRTRSWFSLKKAVKKVKKKDLVKILTEFENNFDNYKI